MLAIGQHAIRVCKSIPVATWSLQKWNSLQGRQVHYVDAAAGASNDFSCLVHAFETRLFHPVMEYHGVSTKF